MLLSIFPRLSSLFNTYLIKEPQGCIHQPVSFSPWQFLKHSVLTWRLFLIFLELLPDDHICFLTPSIFSPHYSELYLHIFQASEFFKIFYPSRVLFFWFYVLFNVYCLYCTFSTCTPYKSLLIVYYPVSSHFVCHLPYY